jgi:two-component system nitrate/nitrite response regulator NarL
MRSVIAGATGRSDEQRAAQALNARERAVLKRVFEGLTNKEIAAQLQISEGSVKAVMQQLFDKTGVRTRSQLVRIALERRAEEWLRGEPGSQPL